MTPAEQIALLRDALENILSIARTAGNFDDFEIEDVDAANIALAATAAPAQRDDGEDAALLSKAFEAVELLHFIRCHPRRHDLERDWLTKADRVLAYWDTPNTKQRLKVAIANAQQEPTK